LFDLDDASNKLSETGMKLGINASLKHLTPWYTLGMIGSFVGIVVFVIVVNWLLRST
jgi:hypothetical protein